MLKSTAVAALTLGMASAGHAATVYIPDGSADQVIVVDSTTGKVIRRIKGLEAVHGLAGSPGSRYLVAGSYADVTPDEADEAPKPDSVSEDEHAEHHAAPAKGAMPSDQGISILTVLDAGTGEIVRRLEVPGAVHHVAVSRDGGMAAATHPAGDGISLIDLDAMEYKGFVATGPLPNYAVFSKDGTNLYVSNTGNGTISDVDVDRGIVARNIVAGEAPEHVLLTEDGSTLYAADADAGVVHEISLPGGEVARSFDIGGALHGFDLSDDGSTLFVSSLGAEKLIAVDLASGEMRGNDLSPAPYHLTTIVGTNTLFVSSQSEPKVWIVDQATLSATNEIPVGDVGHQMVVMP
ncbi:YncE family protein [uncultured Paracoccus sp.]|uniref:YncE family protein n=1 Tax=uncultured Paracoccus sp. TaxID=189685 RepID=UPI002639CF92|nr:YncE family protein [uncultured Paracoccus sp.]